jgi:magnesium chelatase subunit D
MIMTILNFPFTAIVGQPLFKLALQLATINPAIGGVLVSGPRGSAKSTLARSLADIAPFDGDSYPFVTLPLGATEEMLVGSLNLQEALKKQNVIFQEGLLAKANGGVLYVDEVNLLQDNLVDLLLDVAASGTNVIERDGISHSHTSQFLLMGTMNPDEGELRPQLHDRFGFSVELGNEYSVEDRVAIVRLREAFDIAPQAFIGQYQAQQVALQTRLTVAKRYLTSIVCSDEFRVTIAERCQQAYVDGLRADIVWYRAAVAHAAWRLSDKEGSREQGFEDKGAQGSKESCVTNQDIDVVEELVLAHRRKMPPSNPSSNNSSPKNESSLRNESAAKTPPKKPSPPQKPFSRPPGSYSQTSHSEDSSSQDSSSENGQNRQKQQKKEQGDWGQMQAQQQLSSEHKPHLLLQSLALQNSSLQNKRHSSANKMRVNKKASFLPRSSTSLINSPTVSAKGKVASLNSRAIDWFSSFVANAGQWPLTQLRYRKAKIGQPVLHLVLLDTSASTLHNTLLAHAKAAVLSIAEQAYLNREQLTILGFGNQQVKILLPQKKAPKVLRRWLDSVTAAGGTPLREVLDQALHLQQKYLQKSHSRQSSQATIRTYLITDGRTTQTVDDKELFGDVVVIDTEQSSVRRGKGKLIAESLCAGYIPLFAY